MDLGAGAFEGVDPPALGGGHDDKPPSSASADCNPQVRVNAVVYNGWSFIEKDGRRLGNADRASCDDNGQDSTGSYFADEPERVTVWSFDGYPASEVLRVKFGKASYTLFLARSVNRAEQDRILQELNGSGS